MTEITPSREAATHAARVALAELKAKGWESNPAYWVGRLEAALTGVLRATDHRDASASSDTSRSVRPVIEHALTVYYDGNAELARTLIDRLIAEQGEES